MPPRVRFPHGLTKDPRLMSWGEKGVFALLAGSVGFGVYKLATDPWGEPKPSDVVGAKAPEATSSFVMPGESKNDTLPPTVSDTPVVLSRTEGGVEMKAIRVDDGVTDIRFDAPPKK